MIHVVIPHYGSDEMLEKLVWEMEGNAYVSEVTVIDNNKENRGFTVAVNEGIEIALEDSDSQYVAIVNNDVFPLECSFTPLVDRLRESDDAAIVAPMSVKFDDEDQIVHAGGLQAFPNGIHDSGLRSLGQCSKAKRFQWLSFVVVLIRKSCFVEVGLLDERMFLIGSDSDWCYRARYCGYDCWYEPTSIWSHRMGESSRISSEESMLIQRRDMYRWYKKWIEVGGLFQELSTEVIE